MATLRIVSVVGARPQFVKAAAMSRAIAAHNQRQPAVAVEEVLVHTGQHYDRDLSDAQFADLGLADPAYDLEVGSGSHGIQTGLMLQRIEPVLVAERPDVVVVHGDTNSTLAGALAAAKLGLAVAHVEAGLRSGRRDMAEELNRVVTDHLSTLRFCSSATGVANLAAEGIVAGVEVVGDVMHDVLRWAMAEAHGAPAVSGLGDGPYAVATVHRAENTDDPDRLRAILDGLGRLAHDGLPIVLPLHPRTAAALGKGSPPPGVVVVAPLPYRSMIGLMARAEVVLTDSGGLQKEAYWLGVPCVTLREETEWVETVAEGWNILAGADADAIVVAATRPRPAGPRAPLYGDGHAADRIVRRLALPRQAIRPRQVIRPR